MCIVGVDAVGFPLAVTCVLGQLMAIMSIAYIAELVQTSSNCHASNFLILSCFKLPQIVVLQTSVQKTLEPTSLQKRKHQINQLAAQAASMERDLMERSGASRVTKAQTRSKYGW